MHKKVMEANLVHNENEKKVKYLQYTLHFDYRAGYTLNNVHLILLE